MAANCSFFLSSMAFTTVFAPYSSPEGSGLLILPHVDGFHDGLCALFPSGWQRIAHSCTHQRLSQRFARLISQQLVANCLFFLSSTALTKVFAPYCSVDGCGLLILPCVDGFHDGLHPYFSSYRSLQRLFFRSYMTLPTVCMPYGSTVSKSAYL